MKIMTGKILRLINFLLDTVFYFAFMIAFLIVFKNVIEQEYVKWISILIYFLYYFLFEYLKGQTLGKIITRSKVISLSVNEDYYFIRIIFRTLMRFIPIDVFSYLFSYRGLHDWVSITTIIKL